MVNGVTVDRLPVFVDPEHDTIVADGRTLPKMARARRVYVMLHKPTRTLCVASDEPGADRRTVMDLVEHPAAPRLFPVGRLEYDATGLLLLTNDGELANRLTHPRYGVSKVYHALVKGEMSDEQAHDLARAMFHADRKAARMAREGREGEGVARPTRRVAGAYRASHVEIRVIKREAGKSMLEITLSEGRNHQVGSILSAAGFPLKKLAQVAVGPLKLRALGPGAWRELERAEVAALLDATRQKPTKRGPGGAVRASARPPERRAGGSAPARETQGPGPVAGRPRARRARRGGDA